MVEGPRGDASAIPAFNIANIGEATIKSVAVAGAAVTGQMTTAMMDSIRSFMQNVTAEDKLQPETGRAAGMNEASRAANSMPKTNIDKPLSTQPIATTTVALSNTPVTSTGPKGRGAA